MIRLRRILCAVDKSRCSMEALTYAEYFALKNSAELHLLYVIDTRHFDDFPPFEFPGPESDTVRRIKDELAVKVSDETKSKVNVVITVAVGMPVQKILSISRLKDIDLIVIGTHGRTGMARAIMGSVAANVLKKARCPVLTVRQSD
ncbi:MAG: universal stress protein [Planctomycetes bacterium]|nr:universal stress protein [Planctomycetota bacterium]